MNQPIVIPDPRNKYIHYIGMDMGNGSGWTLAALDIRNLDKPHVIVKGVKEDELYDYAATIYNASCSGLTKELKGDELKKALNPAIKELKSRLKKK